MFATPSELGDSRQNHYGCRAIADSYANLPGLKAMAEPDENEPKYEQNRHVPNAANGRVRVTGLAFERSIHQGSSITFWFHQDSHGYHRELPTAAWKLVIQQSTSLDDWQL